jgi:hypothetical protein
MWEEHLSMCVCVRERVLECVCVRERVYVYA